MKSVPTKAEDDSVHGSTGSPRMGGADDSRPTVTVTVVAAWVHRVERRILALPPGATLRDALLRAGDIPVDSMDDSDLDVGVWGKRVPLETLLRDGDRIECYRPITADPKQARHNRASEQGYRWQGRTRRAARAS